LLAIARLTSCPQSFSVSTYPEATFGTVQHLRWLGLVIA
jgi:hypothetical protein